jgi:hypothetical protein
MVTIYLKTREMVYAVSPCKINGILERHVTLLHWGGCTVI